MIIPVLSPLVKKGFPMKRYLPFIRDSLVLFSCLVLAARIEGLANILVL